MLVKLSAHINFPRLSRGFTLVELVITVAIAAVIMSLAAPSYRGFMVNRQLGAASSDFLLAMMQARAEAIRQGQMISVLPTDGSSWASGWYLAVVSNSCAVTGTAFGIRDPLSTLVTINAAETNNSFVQANPSYTYAPSGFPFTSCGAPYYAGAMNGSLVFQALETGRQNRIIVSNSGRARMCDPSKTTCTAD